MANVLFVRLAGDMPSPFIDTVLALIRQRHAVNHADHVIVPSPYLYRQIRGFFGPTAAPLSVVPLGFDSTLFTPAGEKKDQVLSAALAKTNDRATLKGIETLIAAAPEVDCPFILAGLGPALIESLRDRQPDNVTLLGPLPQAALIEKYRESAIYAQCSYTETFGACVAEAMLCGCVPVVRGVGNLPLLVGDTGYAFGQDPVDAIQAARVSPGHGERARSRVATLYPLSDRADRIAAVLEGLL